MRRMPRKKQKPEEELVITAESTEKGVEPLEVKPEPEKGKERLSFAVTPNGQIDWEGSREETRKRLKEVIINSPIPGMEVKREPPFSRETLMMVWSGVGALEAWAATQWMKVPQDIAYTVFPYNKEQCELLADMLNKVLAKYEWVNSVKYKEEFDLAGAFLTISVMKIMACREQMGNRKKEEHAKKGSSPNTQATAGAA